MKLRIGCLILVLSSLTLSMHAATCTQGTLKGNYAAAAIGYIAGSPGAGVTLFLETYDGVSKISGSGVENVNGTVSVGVTISGTYSLVAVGANCTFTSATTDSLGNTLNISGTVSGGEMVGISTSAGTELQFTAYKQAKTQCTEADTAGSFTEQVYWDDTPVGVILVNAQLKVTSKGVKKGSVVENYQGGTIVSGTFKGTTSMKSDCTFTTTSTYSFGGTEHFFGVGGISENGVKLVMVGTNSGHVGLATLH
jgi:hypothetical protein